MRAPILQASALGLLLALVVSCATLAQNSPDDPSGSESGEGADVRSPQDPEYAEPPSAQSSATALQADPFAHDEPPDDPPAEATSQSRPGWPSLPVPSVDGRSLTNLTAAQCLERVRTLRLPVERAQHSDVEAALKPNGPINGVRIEFTGRRQQGRIMDCRLLLVIHAWAPTLRALGVTRIRHLSALRPGAVVRSTGRPSGHARGFAFDPRFFDGAEGTFDVLEDWEDRTRGGRLCEQKAEGAATAGIRAAVCLAIQQHLFQVVVSPHHNDAHQNHLHLEVVPGSSWSWSG